MTEKHNNRTKYFFICVIIVVLAIIAFISFKSLSKETDGPNCLYWGEKNHTLYISSKECEEANNKEDINLITNDKETVPWKRGKLCACECASVA